MLGGVEGGKECSTAGRSRQEHGAATWERGLLGLLEAAEAGSDHQLAFARAYAAAARSDDALDRLEGLLDGSVTLDGLAVDTDLRWTLLKTLAARGRADQDRIGEELARDNTISGQERAAAARAMRPTAAAKDQAWTDAVLRDDVPNETQRNIALAFNVAGQDTIDGLLVGFPGQEASLAGRTSDPAASRPGGFRRVWFAIDEAELRAQFVTVHRTLLEQAQYGELQHPVLLHIAAGLHSLVLKSDGTVIHTGSSSYGLADVPSTLTDTIAIATGGNHSLALKSDGTLYSWGYNAFGQLGDDSVAQSTLPVTGLSETGAGVFDADDYPVLSLSAASLVFGAQATGSVSAVQSVTLTNTGTGALVVRGIGAIGEFAQTNDCPVQLAPAASCTLSVVFAPLRAGVRAGAVAITSNTAARSVALSGTGSGASVASAQLSAW